MTRLVMKFGGTSVGDVERIRRVARLVAAERKPGRGLAVVVSAMSGETNRLVALAGDAGAGLAPEQFDDEYDVVVATGEQVTTGLLALALRAIGVPARSWQGWQAPVISDDAHGKARITDIPCTDMIAAIDAGEVAVIPGFQGKTADGRITTLGRGGSDTSAVAVAAALKAEECLIYTDVDGVYTTDPRIVPDARRLATISFEEMLEMASLGSEVLQIRSVEFAGKYRVPTRVLSSFTPWDIPLDEEARSGTLITFEEDEKMEQAVVAGIAFNRDEAKITVIGVPDRPGIAFQILGPVAEANIDVDVIIQNLSHDGRTDFSFTVPRNDFPRALDVLKNRVQPAIGAAEVRGDTKIAKVSIVGIGMRSHVGVASKMFRTLADEGINIQMISTSEIKISAVVDEKYLELAVRVLHKAFDLEQGAA